MEVGITVSIKVSNVRGEESELVLMFFLILTFLSSLAPTFNAYSNQFDFDLEFSSDSDDFYSSYQEASSVDCSCGVKTRKRMRILGGRTASVSRERER